MDTNDSPITHHYRDLNEREQWLVDLVVYGRTLRNKWRAAFYAALIGNVVQLVVSFMVR
jgi:hypothetical protein